MFFYQIQTESSSEGIASGEMGHLKSGYGNFDPEKFFRICLRLRDFLSVPPAALAPVLKFPEVFVLIAVTTYNAVNMIKLRCAGVVDKAMFCC